MSLTINPDRIRVARPLRQAALQMQPSREHEPTVPLANRIWFDTPPETVPGIYSGVAFGRLTVIGKVSVRSSKYRTGSHATYLVRCQCGTYETRKPSVIRRASSPAMCRFCQHTEQLRATKAPKRQPAERRQRASLFEDMRAVAMALGLSWSESKDGRDRTLVSIAGGEPMLARDLVALGTLEAFQTLVRQPERVRA